jgi:hypothetical protein
MDKKFSGSVVGNTSPKAVHAQESVTQSISRLIKVLGIVSAKISFTADIRGGKPFEPTMIITDAVISERSEIM